MEGGSASYLQIYFLFADFGLLKFKQIFMIWIWFFMFEVFASTGLWETFLLTENAVIMIYIYMEGFNFLSMWFWKYCESLFKETLFYWSSIEWIMQCSALLSRLYIISGKCFYAIFIAHLRSLWAFQVGLSYMWNFLYQKWMMLTHVVFKER